VPTLKALYGIAVSFKLSYFLWRCYQSIWHIACSTLLHSQRAKPMHSIATKKRYTPTTTTVPLMPVLKLPEAT